ncbi:MAG: hypothetical protein K2Y26_01000 [Gemmatimonadaceae bacterium]|nr:hypothetical protein [Gemmatimonadaceae bacterium]
MNITKLGLEFDASGVVRGTKQAGTALDEMGGKAKQAGQALDQSSTVASRAAAESDRAARGLAKSWGMATTEMKTGAQVVAELRREVLAKVDATARLSTGLQGLTTGTTVAAQASRVFGTAIGALGGPVGIALTAVNLLPLAFRATEEAMAKSRREVEDYRKSLGGLSESALAASIATERQYQAQLRSESRTTLGGVRQRDRLIDASNARIAEIEKVQSEQLTKQLKAQAEMLARLRAEQVDAAASAERFRMAGAESAAAFDKAAAQWRAAGNVLKPFAQALAEGDSFARQLDGTTRSLTRALTDKADAVKAATQAAKDEAAAAREAAREREKEEKALRAILDSRMGYRQQANTGTLTNPLGLGDAKDVDRTLETMRKAREAVLASIATRQESIDSMKQELEAMKEGEAAVRRLTVARAQDRAVAEAYAKLPEGATLGIGEEDTIRQQVAEWYRLNGAIEDARRGTGEWLNSLRDVAGVVQLIAAGLGERNVAQAANGAQSLFSGIQRAGTITNAAGSAVGFGSALSGAAGLSGFLAATGGAGAIVGGVVQIGQALDLFGERAREEARLLRERAQNFNAALAEFGNQQATSLGAAVQGNLSNALKIARDAGYTGAQFTSAADIDREAQRIFQQGAEDGKNALLQLGRQLEQLAITVRANELVLRDRLAFEEQLARGDLSARRLRAQGADEEAAALARQLAGQKEVRDAVGRFGADSAYVAHLKEVLQIEEAAAQAMARRTAEQRAFDTRMGNAGLTARLLGAQGDPMADELRAYIQAEQELRDAREKGLDIALLVAAQEAERMQRRVQQEQEAQQKQLGYAAREAALTNSINAQLIQKAAQWQAELNALSPTDTAGRDRVNQLNEAELLQMRAGFRSQAEGIMGNAALGAETNSVTRAVMQATMERAAAEKQLAEYYNAGIISAQEYADTLENVTIATARAIEESKRAMERDRLGFDADLAGRRSSLNPMDRDAAKRAYDAMGKAEYQAALDNALKLKEAGAITNDVFMDFIAVLNEQFSPAIRDAAWAVQEAARMIDQGLSTLNQQWSVFGTDPMGQVADLGKLYGFDGMSPEQIKGLFTKFTPGVELTPQQMAQNQAVYGWFSAYNRANMVVESDRQAAERLGRTPSTPGWNPGPAPDIPVLGGDSISYRSSASMTETSATRLVDYASAQLSVQRRILQLLEAKVGAAPTPQPDLLSPTFVDRLDTAFGTRQTDSALLVGGRVL